MFDDIRSEFDLPRHICYLNAAYATPQPKRVLQAVMQGAERRARPWRLSPADFFEEVEALRHAFASLVRCPADNIAIVPSVSYGIATAASNLSIDAGESLMVLADEFPSNYFSWLRLAESTGATVRVVQADKKQDWTAAVRGHLETHGEQTRIAALSHHHWITGEAVDLVELRKLLRASNTSVVVDLTQTIGACPVDLARLDPDFMVTAGYKWLFCPYGLSFLYVADRHLDGRPIEESWANRLGSQDFARLADYAGHYQAGARRYDVGERASFANVAAALEAVEMVQEWGVDRIAGALAKTNERISLIFAERGFETMAAANRAPHFQSVRLPGRDTRSLAAKLSGKAVFVSQRGERLRVAPHLYTDEEDLQRLAEALDN